MGNCTKKNRVEPSAQSVYAMNQAVYPRKISVLIKKKDSRGRINETIKVSISHTEPLLCVSEDISISFSIWGTACVLPGLDPHNRLFKVCQDLCFFSSNGNFTIVGVFDGHGKEGEHIVEFCIREADNFFENLIPSYENKPEAFLTDLLQSINTKIRDPSFIVDIANSGCCCVLALLHKNQLYIANIGNSRAVLATNKDMNMGLRRPSTFCEEKHFLREIAKRRMNKLIKEPNAQELTYPHTTENQKEFMRILRCGGRLQQNSDKFGNRSGPYYIWKNYSNVPGLIVSRTIGNIIAEDIGVISSHYSHQQKITAHDEFLVLASEGIWAVMTNEEVINYITAYKDLAIKDIESERNSDVVNTGNSCIAQLLCEEARIRWLLVVEHENIMIDDITCVILEFDHRTEKKSQTAYRMPLEKIKTFQSTRFAANDTENF